MNDLATRPLSDAIDKIIDFRGKTPLKLGMEWGGGDIRALSANNVTQGKIDFSKECYYASEALYSKWMNKGSCAQGDILLTMEAPLGNVAQIPDDKKYILSQRTVLIKLNQNKILNDYAFYLFSFDNFQKELYKNATGSTVIGIQQKKLLKIELTYPLSIINQKKIAKILSTCDTVISQTEQAIKKYQAIKQGMMTDLFTRGIDVNTGKLRLSYEERPDLYKESELGWIPKDWELSKFEDFVIPIDGDRGHAYPNQSQLHSEGHCLFLSAKNVTKSGFAFNKNIFISHERDNLMGNGKLDRGDIIITTRGTVGNIAMYDDSVTYEHIRINSGMLILRNKVSEKIANQFIKAFLLSHVFSRQLERVLSGSAQPQITVKNVNAIYMLFPVTLVEQESIVNRMIAMDRKIQTEQDTLKKYQQIKAGLMQDLLTGKVEVQTDDVS